MGTQTVARKKSDKSAQRGTPPSPPSAAPRKKPVLPKKQGASTPAFIAEHPEKVKGKPGAPVGNINYHGHRIWRDAIIRALQRRSRIDQRAELDKLADKLITTAKRGLVPALREFGDRLDGKPTQVISGVDGGPIMTQVQEVKPVQVYLPDNGRDPPKEDTP